MNLKMLQLPQLPQLLQLLVWLCCVLPLAAPARWQPESTCNLMTKSLMDLYGQLKLRPLLGGDQKFLKDTSGALMQFQLCADPSVCFSDRQNILVKDEDDEEYEDTAADDDNDDDNKCEHDNDEEEEEPEEEQGEDQEQDQDLDDDDDDDGSFMERVSCIIKGLHESSRAIADDLKDLEAQLQGRLEKQKQDAGQDTESAGADEEEQTTPDECTNQQSAEEEGQGEGQGQGEGEVDKSTEECEKCEEDAGGEPQQKDDSEEEQQQEDECEVEPKEVPEKIPDMDPPPNSQKCPLTMAEDDDDEAAEPENDYDNDMDNDNDMDMDMDMDTDMDMDMDMEMEPDAEPEQSDMYPLLQLLKYEQQPLQSAKASPCLAQKLCGESSLWDDDLAMEGHCHGSADPDDCLDSDWETDLYNFYC
ncbi:serine-aspartate repeat-containing protein F [Drosophila obscura]|uniref:serine-aspartate repeat-containing protein F n=1 Tax=Drosophila obscura TaxID=7282 RepID=UPI001BB2C2FB|nr:serine-aspartate repeat-containing protein F [Drosophila obscura]